MPRHLAAHFIATRRRSSPTRRDAPGIALRDAAQQQMISASTSSATLRVLENGALKTGMPRVLRGVEIHLVGADAEAADADQALRMRRRFGPSVG